VFNKVFKFGKKPVLNKLSLKETSLIDWTIKESLEAHIPKEIGAILLCKKVFTKVSCEIRELIFHDFQRISFSVSGNKFNQISMEQF